MCGNDNGNCNISLLKSCQCQWTLNTIPIHVHRRWIGLIMRAEWPAKGGRYAIFPTACGVPRNLDLAFFILPNKTMRRSVCVGSYWMNKTWKQQPIDI